MKYEIKNAENAILKTLIVLIFYIFVLIISMYSFIARPYEELELFNKILNYLSYPAINEYTLADNLLYIFSNLYFVLYFVIFYIYEYLCFHNNLATRYQTKKWIGHKYLIGIGFIILISLIQYGCIYSIFGSLMPLSIKYYIYPIIYKVFIMCGVYTLFNIFKTNKYIFLITILMIGYVLLHFNIVIYVLLIIFSFILNYLFFDLRIFSYKLDRKK